MWTNDSWCRVWFGYYSSLSHSLIFDVSPQKYSPRNFPSVQAQAVPRRYASHFVLTELCFFHVIENIIKRTGKYVKILSPTFLSLHIILLDTDLMEDTAFNSSSIVEFVFVAAGKCLRSRCLAVLGWGTDTQTVK
jgi:hypothetical protein